MKTTSLRKAFILVFSILLMGLTVITVKASSNETCEHDWSEWEPESEDADCTKGYITERHCYWCNKRETKQVEPTSHTWGEWEVTSEANCGGGEETRMCNMCYEEETRDTPPVGEHNWDDWVVYEEATCTESGVEYRECTVCEEEEEREIPATGHTWTKWKTTVKPTAFKKGKAYRECNYCEKEQTKTLAKRKMTANEKSAQAIVVKYLKAAKKYDWKTMNSSFAVLPDDNVGYPADATVAKYLKKYNQKKLSWKVVDITGSGKKYTVSVKVTRPNLYKMYYDIVLNQLLKFWNSGDHSDEAATAAGNKIAVQLKKKIASIKYKTKTETVNIPVMKISGKWKINKKTAEVVDIATAYYNKAFSDAENDFYELID